jgi:hypothetical protein
MTTTSADAVGANSETAPTVPSDVIARRAFDAPAIQRFLMLMVSSRFFGLRGRSRPSRRMNCKLRAPVVIRTAERVANA